MHTNDHLIKELDETKRRHQHEVQQMNWSYEQLKKSMNVTSSMNGKTRYRNYLARDGGSIQLADRRAKETTDKLSGSALFYGDQDS